MTRWVGRKVPTDMPGKMIEFEAKGRSCSGYLATPASGSGPAIIVIQEWWGLVDHIKTIADRFAAAGMVALAPDLYHGDSTTNPDDAGRMMMALNIAEAGQELAAAADYLLALDAVSPKKVGALGFCMGGQLALFAATQHEQIAAAVDFYGIHPSVDLEVAKLGCPVLAHFGKDDSFVPEADARGLVAKIAAAGGTVDSHFYEAGHAFFNDARPEAHHEPSANEAWDRTLKFLQTHLV